MEIWIKYLDGEEVCNMSMEYPREVLIRNKYFAALLDHDFLDNEKVVIDFTDHVHPIIEDVIRMVFIIEFPESYSDLDDLLYDTIEEPYSRIIIDSYAKFSEEFDLEVNIGLNIELDEYYMLCNLVDYFDFEFGRSVLVKCLENYVELFDRDIFWTKLSSINGKALVSDEDLSIIEDTSEDESSDNSEKDGSGNSEKDGSGNSEKDGSGNSEKDRSNNDVDKKKTLQNITESNQRKFFRRVNAFVIERCIIYNNKWFDHCNIYKAIQRDYEILLYRQFLENIYQVYLAFVIMGMVDSYRHIASVCKMELDKYGSQLCFVYLSNNDVDKMGSNIAEFLKDSQGCVSFEEKD